MVDARIPEEYEYANLPLWAGGDPQCQTIAPCDHEYQVATACECDEYKWPHLTCCACSECYQPTEE